jgi:hypothetical protein
MLDYQINLYWQVAGGYASVISDTCAIDSERFHANF